MNNYDSFRHVALLSCISNTYDFKDLNPVHPSLACLGTKRVVSVVINESSQPELGLADDSDLDSVEYYPLDRLVITPAGSLTQAHRGAHREAQAPARRAPHALA